MGFFPGNHIILIQKNTGLCKCPYFYTTFRISYFSFNIIFRFINFIYYIRIVNINIFRFCLQWIFFFI